MIFSEKSFNLSPPLLLNNATFKRVTIHRHLGLMLSSNLDWSHQIHYVCLRTNRKLAVLRSIKFIQRRTLDLLYKITIRSIIDYCLPVYWHTLKVSEKNLLEQIQYKSAKLVTGALKFTSKERLNIELGYESIEKRADILGLSLFHKTLLGLQRPLINKCMPTLAAPVNYNTRKRRIFSPFRVGKQKYNNFFFILFSKKYESLPQSIRKLRDQSEFKT